jgi:hypothetical protein
MLLEADHIRIRQAFSRAGWRSEMSRTATRPRAQTAPDVSPQAAMLKQIAFHGVLVLFTALLITGVLKMF